MFCSGGVLARCTAIKHIHFQTDDLFLLKYLRATDWDIDRAVEAMQKMYATRVSCNNCVCVYVVNMRINSVQC